MDLLQEMIKSTASLAESFALRMPIVWLFIYVLMGNWGYRCRRRTHTDTHKQTLTLASWGPPTALPESGDEQNKLCHSCLFSFLRKTHTQCVDNIIHISSNATTVFIKMKIVVFFQHNIRGKLSNSEWYSPQPCGRGPSGSNSLLAVAASWSWSWERQKKGHMLIKALSKTVRLALSTSAGEWNCGILWQLSSRKCHRLSSILILEIKHDILCSNSLSAVNTVRNWEGLHSLHKWTSG